MQGLLFTTRAIRKVIVENVIFSGKKGHVPFQWTKHLLGIVLVFTIQYNVKEPCTLWRVVSRLVSNNFATATHIIIHTMSKETALSDVVDISRLNVTVSVYHILVVTQKFAMVTNFQLLYLTASNHWVIHGIKCHPIEQF